MTSRLTLHLVACSALVALVPLALVPPPAVAQTAGVVAAVNQTVRGTQPGRSIRTITLGANVVRNERIDVDSRGLVQILLADGTTFTVGPNSSLVIDSFVYNPDANTAQVTATVTRGVFRFVGGRTSKTPNGARINTPVGTVGIRGAVVNLDLRGQGGKVAQFDMTFGNEVTLSQSGRVLRRIHRAGYSVVIGSDNRLQVVRTPRETAAELQALLTGRAGGSGGANVAVTDERVAASNVAQGGPQQGGLSVTGDLGPDRTNVAPVPENSPTGLSPTTSAALSAPPLAGATATYTGTASGVVTTGGSTSSATGTSTMTWDFGSRDGILAINNFGTRSFGTGVSDTSPGGAAPATFAGASGGAGSDTFSAEGGFFTDEGSPARRAIGTFNYETSDGGETGSGVFDTTRLLPVAPVAPD